MFKEHWYPQRSDGLPTETILGTLLMKSAVYDYIYFNPIDKYIFARLHLCCYPVIRPSVVLRSDKARQE